LAGHITALQHSRYFDPVTTNAVIPNTQSLFHRITLADGPDRLGEPAHLHMEIGAVGAWGERMDDLWPHCWHRCIVIATALFPLFDLGRGPHADCKTIPTSLFPLWNELL
jgi:hypothetical protein